MKVYIAGKITGNQGYQAKFRRAAAGLRMCGNIVLNPAELPEGMEAAAAMLPGVTMVDDPYVAAEGADAVVLVTGLIYLFVARPDSKSNAPEGDARAVADEIRRRTGAVKLQ